MRGGSRLGQANVRSLGQYLYGQERFQARLMARTVLIPKHIVTHLGNGDHSAGAALLDAITAPDAHTYYQEPVEHPTAEPGSYLLRHEDVKRAGRGSHKRGFERIVKLLKDRGLFTDNS